MTKKPMQIRDAIEWLKRFDPTEELVIKAKDGEERQITGIVRATHPITTTGNRKGVTVASKARVVIKGE